jgi:lipopolysaccharide biosynthesis glycosyltransferase
MGFLPSELAEAYNCLAQVDDDVYTAIKNTSYALESFYDDKYVQNLIKLIDNDPNRAMYRKSLVHLLGRESSLEPVNYDLEASAALQKQISVDFNPRKTIDVAFVLNDKYVDYAKTTIASILLNADLNSDYNFYIVMDPTDPISAQSQAELKAMSKLRPYKIEFREFPLTIIPDEEVFNKITPKLFIFKALLENVFPDLDSLIVLDVDILVQRDLYTLQHQPNFNKFILAGALSAQRLGETNCNFLYTYVNSGVLVYNLEMMRKTNNTQNILETFRDLGSLSSQCIAQPEQDALNILYSDQILHMSKRWNYIPAYPSNTKCMPFITHYAGVKPWADRYKYSPPAHIKLYQYYWNFANSSSILTKS